MPESLRDRIGQMMIVGFRGITPREAQPAMRHMAAGSTGGVVLYDVDAHTGGPRNFHSRDQLRELISALKAASEIPVLVTVDAEGGFYHRLKEQYGFGAATTAAEMGERNDPAFTRAAAGRLAAEMADVGIDMNLAPVVDLLNPANLEVAARRRSFSPDPAVVAAHAREFILGHHDHGVLAAAKHFPGMGGVVRSAVDIAAEVIDSWSTDELEPYRALIEEGLLDAVLASRMTLPQLDPDVPACLSPRVVYGLLRRSMGFDGVVISDAMENAAIWEAFGFERGVIMAVNAGVDMLMFCNIRHTVPYSDERGYDAVQVIFDAIDSGEIAESRINEACERILRLKSRLTA